MPLKDKTASTIAAALKFVMLNRNQISVESTNCLSLLIQFPTGPKEQGINYHVTHNPDLKELL
jgi:hypothetical protein